MLSFTNGKKVAVICGGEYDDTPIFITEEEKEPDLELENEDEVFDYLDDDDFNINHYKRLTMKDKLKLARALQRHQEPLDEHLIQKYNDLGEKLEKRLKKEIDLSSGV